MSNIKYNMEVTIYDMIRSFMVCTKVYDGIFFQSSSRKCLNKLIDFYEETRDNAKGEISSDFFNRIEGMGLIITDYDLIKSTDKNGKSHMTKADSNTAHSIGPVNRVYIGEDIIESKKYGVMYHELAHAIDFHEELYETGYDGISKALAPYSPDSLDKGESVNSMELFSCLMKFQKDYNEYNKEIDKILETPEEQAKIEEKARKDFKRIYKSTKYDSRTFEEFKKWLYGEYKDEILCKSGFAAVSDIFDALYLGQVRENPLLPGNSIEFERSSSGAYSITGTKTSNFGHGSKYFGRDGTYRTTEIIANYSDLYNNGKVDLLHKYFPQSFVDGLDKAYKNMILNTYSNKRQDGKSNLRRI